MQFFTLITAAAATFASTATALPSSINERAAGSAVAKILAINAPISGSHSQKNVYVPLGKLTHVDDLSITSLKLESIKVDVPNVPKPSVNDITCQMYKDQYGVQPGSAEFTKAKPALISTNSVDFGWV
ncbi:hypothetical protein FDECE_18019, partial [Fusarium decemcellulare]